MFVPAPIDKNFVPRGNRRMLRRNARIIVDAARGKDGAPRVVPQYAQYTPCGPGSTTCTPCGPGMVCNGPWGDCVPRSTTMCG
jgi:hypothetical protein